jgi:hypothetical protein
MRGWLVTIPALATLALGGPFAASAAAEPEPACVTGAIGLVSPPVISGSTAVGGTLTVSTGGWSSCGERLTGYTYSWSGAATSSTNSYVVQPGDAGGTVFAHVAACNVDGCAPAAAASIAIPPAAGGGTGGCAPQACPSPPLKPSDRDGDGVPDASDDCPDVWDLDQADADADRVGNACDTTVPADFLNGALSTESGSEGASFVVDPGTLALLPCRHAWARYTYVNLVRLYVLWKYQLSFDFCYVPGSKIVRVTGILAHGTYAAWPWSFQGNLVGPRLLSGPPGYAVHAFAQGKFAACVGIAAIAVCGATRSPYLDLYASAAPSTWFGGGLS